MLTHGLLGKLRVCISRKQEILANYEIVENNIRKARFAFENRISSTPAKN